MWPPVITESSFYMKTCNEPQIEMLNPFIQMKSNFMQNNYKSKDSLGWLDKDWKHFITHNTYTDTIQTLIYISTMQLELYNAESVRVM